MGNEKLYTRREVLGLIGGTLFAYEVAVDVLAFEAAGEIHYPVTRLPMKGLTEKWWIAQPTDFHIGSEGSDKVNPQVCQQVAMGMAQTLRSIGAVEERTILANTGDGVNGSRGIYTDVDEFREGMRELDRIPAGERILVPGNHDVSFEDSQTPLHYEYSRLGYEIMGWYPEDRLILNSETVPFQIIGTPDFTTSPGWYSHADASLFTNIDWDKPALWLTHNAQPFNPNHLGGILDQEGLETKVLAGHTHGGQVSHPTGLGLAGRLYALSRIEYESPFITGTYEIGADKNVTVNIFNGIGSNINLRTAERQAGIVELYPAVQ